MMPLIEREIIDKQEWIDRKEVLDIFALSEFVPGSLSINNSILIGYKIGKTLGAVVAMLGTVLPSLLIIIAFAALSNQLEEIWVVKAAFMGIRSAVAALILETGIKFLKLSSVNRLSIIISICTVFFIVFIGINPAIIILSGGIIGIISILMKNR